MIWQTPAKNPASSPYSASATQAPSINRVLPDKPVQPTLLNTPQANQMINPFAVTTPAASTNPFAAASNPFALPSTSTNPFASSTTTNPFSGTGTTSSNPFALSTTATNPFATTGTTQYGTNQTNALFNPLYNPLAISMTNLPPDPTPQMIINVVCALDPAHQACMFKAIFFNNLTLQHLQTPGILQPPAGISHAQYLAAQRLNPSPHQLYPVVLMMFQQLKDRVAQQLKRMEMFRSRLKELNALQTQLRKANEVSLTQKVKEFRQSQTVLKHKMIHIMRMVGVVQLKGLPVLSREEMLLNKLCALQNEMTGGAPMQGKVTELSRRATKARIAIVKAKMAEGTVEGDSARRVKELLKSNEKAINAMAKTVRDDMGITRILRESLRDDNFSERSSTFALTRMIKRNRLSSVGATWTGSDSSSLSGLPGAGSSSDPTQAISTASIAAFNPLATLGSTLTFFPADATQNNAATDLAKQQAASAAPAPAATNTQTGAASTNPFAAAATTTTNPFATAGTNTATTNPFALGSNATATAGSSGALPALSLSANGKVSRVMLRPVTSLNLAPKPVTTAGTTATGGATSNNPFATTATATTTTTNAANPFATAANNTTGTTAAATNTAANPFAAAATNTNTGTTAATGAAANPFATTAPSTTAAPANPFASTAPAASTAAAANPFASTAPAASTTAAAANPFATTGTAAAGAAPANPFAATGAATGGGAIPNPFAQK
ncbi:putative nuclear pore complex protein Nup54 [Monocercomonoides exilis]|uniref:putative nuclear pore complex protein Nup54 n=1 Tax=Monocercomonoides exilis TaxID=2049356 RepID=UPI00355A9054|nr:putative nuclear pore complex protein Nup54 [Monocercomonoides exilis]|eukprot:MONOS_1331.1-p1 / transcript=MONOS_1331.1 / gene=MONOS_1331 / organism=Monocercomonoides_exilis_PA203 / gene_product=unspecified product / transcript_product=unspecified product / location=Mono_scaffold00023:22332-24518(-) / protein_length=728 / sequence_SO=supercontig / SO=protein_coding / is_pseudo=false